MSERCDRCGREIDREESRERATVHVGTWGLTDRPFELGDGKTAEAGSFYHGDAFHALCPECTHDWHQWFALFMTGGEAIARYGRDK